MKITMELRSYFGSPMGGLNVQWGGLNCEPRLYLEQYLVKMISKEHVIIRCENI